MSSARRLSTGVRRLANGVVAVCAGVAGEAGAAGVKAVSVGVSCAATAVGTAGAVAQVGLRLTAPPGSLPRQAMEAAETAASSAVAAFTTSVTVPVGERLSGARREAWHGGALPAELLSLIDPRAGRAHRRVDHRADRVHVEVRGLTSDRGAELAGQLQRRLDGSGAFAWCQVNAVTGRVTVGLDPGGGSVADVLATVRDVELTAEMQGQTWSRHADLPGDREPLLAAALALGADIAGLAAAVALRALPVPLGTRAATAAVALVDAQPRLRRVLESRLGAARTDLVITSAGAAAQAFNHGASVLVVDGGQRVAALLELRASLEAWRRWEAAAHGPGGISVPDPLLSLGRPRPPPTGPIEQVADQSAAASLLTAAAALLGRQGLANAADVLLVGVPKASRTSRESFASALSASLSQQGALSLDRSMWRRLDRVTAVLLDAGALRTGPPLVIAAESNDLAWSTAQVWAAGQVLVDTQQQPTACDAGSPLAPPTIPSAAAALVLAATVRRGGHGAGSAGLWRQLLDDGRVVGRALVGRELHPRADSLLAAARRAGLRVVLAGEPPGGELRSRADELIPAGQSLSGTVRRLQDSGHVVAVVSATAHRALASADVGVGLSTQGPRGAQHVPWTADVVCSDLAAVEQILAATASAREVSARGRTLALSGSALGGLLLIGGSRPGAWHRAVSPVTGAALMGLVVGTRAGRRAGRPLAPQTVPLAPWHALSPAQVLRRLPAPAARPTEELTPARPHLPVGRARLVAALGPAVSLGRYMRQELADPLTPVLTVGAAASAILGAPTDAVLVGAVMGVNALVSALQRQRADQAMNALRLGEQVHAVRVTGPAARDLHPLTTESSAMLVLQTVPASALQPGDVLALGPGDLIPADARLIACDALEVDESGLTGESVTVDKQLQETPGAALSERACMVFEGSVVVTGRARAVVVAVGDATQAGRAVAAVPGGTVAGGVQAQLRSLTDKALPLTLGGGALVSVLGWLRAQPLRAAVADGVAVAVAAVPEGLPLVATVAQLAAARRLSRNGVFVRSSRTVEALGRVDTMCFDKTGTLTEGALRLVELADPYSRWTPRQAERSPDARRLLRAAARACPDPADGPTVHATDRAVLHAADQHLGLQATHVWDPVEEVPFESNRGYAATLGQSRSTLRLIVKGAPEVLLPRCTHVLAPDARGERQMVQLDDRGLQQAAQAIDALARQGLRVLLVARRELRRAPDDLESAIDQLTLMGFVGLADTPRGSTVPTVSALIANNISVRMITGDHPVTARAIAGQLGIPHEHVVTGADLDALDETERTILISQSTVFARVTPEHKVRIVEALQRSGKVVAMTGDGSNDAAAIRLADVGIGLASHGSAAARNAADLVLTSPNLTLLLDALVEGRMMWQRVRDAVAILVGGNAGEVAFTIFGTALAGRAPVGTRQFLLVNLLTDMFPAMAVALAHPRAPLPAAEPDDQRSAEQRRASHAADELAAIPSPELGSALMRSIAVRGTATAAGAGAAWLLGRGTGTPRRASTMGLVALVGTQLGQTLVLGGSSPLVWVTAGASGAALIAVVQTPGVSQFFGCTPLDPAAWTVVALSAAAATAGSVVIPRLLPLLRPLAPSSAVVDRGTNLLQDTVVRLQHQMPSS